MRQRGVFLLAGGSGGHIKPALILKNKLEAKLCPVFIFLNRFFPVENINNVKLLNFSKNKFFFLLFSPIIFLSLLISGIVDKAKIFVGFGGYFTIPGILVAKVLGAKAIIYESNLIPGKANKFLSYFCDYIFLLSEETAKHFPKLRRRKFVRIKPLIRELKTKNKDDERVFSVLVSGGSHGSLFINKLLLQTIQNYEFKNKDLKFILITGAKFYNSFKELLEKYSQLKNLKVKVFDFCHDIEKIYQTTDFFISRAGAQTIIESIYYQIPTLFIPYPYAYGHQLENAKNLYRRGACWVIEQETIDWKILGDFIVYLKNNSDILLEIKLKLKYVKDEFSSVIDSEDFILKLKDERK